MTYHFGESFLPVVWWEKRERECAWRKKRGRGDSDLNGIGQYATFSVKIALCAFSLKMLTPYLYLLQCIFPTMAWWNVVAMRPANLVLDASPIKQLQCLRIQQPYNALVTFSVIMNLKRQSVDLTETPTGKDNTLPTEHFSGQTMIFPVMSRCFLGSYFVSLGHPRYVVNFDRCRVTNTFR